MRKSAWQIFDRIVIRRGITILSKFCQADFLPALAAAALVVSATAAMPQDPVFRSSVEGVLVTVSVRQGNQPVSGLTADDFELTDKGVPQQIASLSYESLPIDVTLLLDVSNSVLGRRLERLKRSVLETATLLRPDDRMRLIAVQFRLREVFAFQPGDQRPPIEMLTASGGTALFDGLAVAMMRSAEPDRRHLVVAYTDGNDTTSVLDAAATREIAGRADAVAYVVVPVSGGRNARAEVPAADLLEDLAARTAGRLVLVDANASITNAFRDVFEQFRTSYVLRYRPTGVDAGGWHEIDVKVKGGPYEVRARKGYGG
jgi:VWFA-related protein